MAPVPSDTSAPCASLSQVGAEDAQQKSVCPQASQVVPREGSAASTRRARVPSGLKGTEAPEPSAAKRTNGSATAQGSKASKKGTGTPVASDCQSKSQENSSTTTEATQSTTQQGEEATPATVVLKAGAQVRTAKAHENKTQQDDNMNTQVLGSNDVIRLLHAS